MIAARLSSGLPDTAAALQDWLALAQLGTWTLDLPGRRLRFDAQAVAMLDPDGIAPADEAQWLARVHRSDRAALQRQLQRVGMETEAFELDLRIASLTPPRSLLLRAQLSRDAQGRPLQLRGVLIDLGSRLRAQRQREQRLMSEAALRARDALLHFVSHELRSPLNGIQSWAHVLETRLPEATPALKRAFAGIRSGVARQVRLIDDLLDASRVLGGRLELQRLPLAVAPALEPLLRDMRATAQARGIALEWSDEAGQARIAGDAGRLRQMLEILLSNALKFTPAGGAVQVQLRVQDGELRITVSDNGCGIPPQRLAQLFDGLGRATSGPRREQGMGLGLAVLQRLVAQHGGSVWAASEGLGRGARFTLRLPLIPVAVAA